MNLVLFDSTMKAGRVIDRLNILVAAIAILLLFATGCRRDTSSTESPVTDRVTRQQAADLAADANAEVRANGMRALAEIGDRPSIEMLIDGLEDDSTVVSRQAQLGLAEVLKRKIYFDATASPEDRARAIAGVRRMWENLEVRDLVEAAKERMPLQYFYDLNTRELFEDHAGLGPVETDSGLHGRMPAGVRAVVFACRDCGDDADRYVAWLEAPAAKLRKCGIPVDAAGVDEQPGELAIRRPEGGAWALRDSTAANEITSAARRCPERPVPLLCRPGR